MWILDPKASDVSEPSFTAASCLLYSVGELGRVRTVIPGHLLSVLSAQESHNEQRKGQMRTGGKAGCKSELKPRLTSYCYCTCVVQFSGVISGLCPDPSQ